jgi:hypothetical protein
MRQNRLYSIPEGLQGGEGWLLVTFCIPDTPDWRRLVTGMVETLTYGRAYDEKTGIIIDAQSVGREIFSTMSMCNLDDLITGVNNVVIAINALELTSTCNCSPDIVVSAIGGGCGCVSELDEPIDPSDASPENPPVGWIEKIPPTIPVNEYRCRLSNYIVDYVDKALEQFILDDVAGTIQFGVAFSLGVIIAVFNFLLASLGVAALMTTGDLLLIAKSIVLFDTDLPGLRTIIANNRDDLICDFYENGTPATQTAAVEDTLDLAGATEAQIAIFKLLVPTKIHEFFFYTLPTAVGARVERDVEGWPLTSDCTGCTLLCTEFLQFGTEVQRLLKSIEISSVDASVVCPNWVQSERIIWFQSIQTPAQACDFSPLYCAPGWTLLMVEITAGVITQGSNDKLRVTNLAGQKVLSTNTLPWVGNIPEVASIAITGTVATSYTIKFTFVEDVV